MHAIERKCVYCGTSVDLSASDIIPDTYLILGIRDKTYEVIGHEGDPKRKTQQSIVDFLRSPVFTGQTCPRVEVRTIFLNGMSHCYYSSTPTA